MVQPIDSRKDRSTSPDFGQLYDAHGDYAARRVRGSFEQEQIMLEVSAFKLPNLIGLLPRDWAARSVVEIGCATGELIAVFPVAPGGRRVGVDISAKNVAAARERFPSTEFIVGDAVGAAHGEFDCAVLSDILEHVDDDAEVLAGAARLGRYVLVNLPLEDNWLNRGRDYGPHDVSGHLRKYSLAQGLELFARAGLKVLAYRRIWIHETNAELQRRELRRRHFGSAHGGALVARLAKGVTFHAARALPSLGRRLFASNLFALAERERDA